MILDYKLENIMCYLMERRHSEYKTESEKTKIVTLLVKYNSSKYKNMSWIIVI